MPEYIWLIISLVCLGIGYRAGAAHERKQSQARHNEMIKRGMIK